MKTTEYIIIRDFRAPELDLYARLSETELLRLHEPERGVFIAESPKVIERALQAGCVPISVLCEERHAENMEKCRKQKGSHLMIGGFPFIRLPLMC